MRIRYAGLSAILLLAVLAAWRVPAASAAAEVRRTSLVFSAVPTQIAGGGFNDLIDLVNRAELEPRGLAPLDKINFSFMFDAELRHFVRQNIAVTAGIGQLKGRTVQTYLPGIGQSIDVIAAVTSIPIHAGAAYYLAPYNQGDFQARAFFGAGFASIVYNRATIEVIGNGVQPDPSSRTTGTNDAPGYYGEFGAHMFFAARYSVMLSTVYRSSLIRNLVDEDTGQLMFDPQGRPLTLDTGGVGFRMALAIGL